MKRNSFSVTRKTLLYIISDNKHSAHSKIYVPRWQKAKKPERVGDITGEPPENIAADTKSAARMANLLEGLEFPATKDEILAHIGKRCSDSKEDQDVVYRIKNNLQDNREYSDTYDVEQTVGLVKQVYSKKKAYVRDKVLSEAQ